MGPLYKWVAFYTDEVKDFLDRLADVEDEEGTVALITHRGFFFFCHDNGNAFI